MKTWKVAFRLSIIVFLMLVQSCAQLPESATTPQTAISLLPTSSATLVPSMTPLPTGSPTPTLTSTVMPTLPVQEAQTKLLQLLSNNGDCRLPCLWGIAPGDSSFQEAQIILEPLSSISDFTSLFPSPGDISPSYVEENFILYTRVAYLYSENGIVNNIAFNAEAHKPLAEGGYENVFDSKFFGEKIGAYTLPHVLSDQGMPSSVMISTFGAPLTRGGTGGFDLLLLYPDEGILVNYTTRMHLTGLNVRGCPSNAHVEMELYPPRNGDAFFELLKGTDWAVKLDDYKPLEEVTNLSVEEFYQTFREPTDQCIETLANLWPVPEP